VTSGAYAYLYLTAAESRGALPGEHLTEGARAAQHERLLLISLRHAGAVEVTPSQGDGLTEDPLDVQRFSLRIRLLGQPLQVLDNAADPFEPMSDSSRRSASCLTSAAAALAFAEDEDAATADIDLCRDEFVTGACGEQVAATLGRGQRTPSDS
jgi:hypothetical protein